MLHGDSDGLPVCIAKTQYSLTDDPKRMGAPTGWTLNINDVSLSAGRGFVVAVPGNMMLMPGLPSHPRAISLRIDGLFDRFSKCAFFVPARETDQCRECSAGENSPCPLFRDEHQTATHRP